MREGHRKERDDLQAKGGSGAARFDLREREDEREREREKEEEERREKERGERRGGRRRSGEDHRKECRRLVVFHTYGRSCWLQGCCEELEVVRRPEQQEQGYGPLSSLPRFPPLPSALETSTCRFRCLCLNHLPPCILTFLIYDSCVTTSGPV